MIRVLFIFALVIILFFPIYCLIKRIYIGFISEIFDDEVENSIEEIKVKKNKIKNKLEQEEKLLKKKQIKNKKLKGKIK